MSLVFLSLMLCVVEVQSVDQLMSSISQLYSQLNVEQYQLQREQQLQTQLTELQRQIEPFEQVTQPPSLIIHHALQSTVYMTVYSVQYSVLCTAVFTIHLLLSNRQNLSCDACMEVKREDNQNCLCAVLYTTFVHNDKHT